jgi:hypothetical protein
MICLRKDFPFAGEAGPLRPWTDDPRAVPLIGGVEGIWPQICYVKGRTSCAPEWRLAAINHKLVRGLGIPGPWRRSHGPRN